MESEKLNKIKIKKKFHYLSRTEDMFSECGKLRAARAFVSYVPHALKCLTCSHAFVTLLLTCLPFFMCLKCLHFLRVLRAFIFLGAFIFYVSYVPSFFKCLACFHFLRALRGFLFLRAFIFLRALRGFLFLRAFIFYVPNIFFCLHPFKGTVMQII